MAPGSDAAPAHIREGTVMPNGRDVRGIVTRLTVLPLTEAGASRAPRPAIAPTPAAVEAVPPGPVSAGLAVGAGARIEDSRHPQVPRAPIEDLRVAGDPEDDRAEEASPVLRAVRSRLRGGAVVPAGTPG
jgi:hypothetical protein